MPPLAALIAAGAAGGGLSAWANSKKDSGRDAGNPLSMDAEQGKQAQSELGRFLNYHGNQNVFGTGGTDYATNQVMNNPLLGQMFGHGGTMDRTNQEEKDLATRGFSLKPEDFEAYGQASDQMAREFGANEGNLANALSSRGLSFSGNPSAQSFSNLQGNKQEQLGQVSRQMANDRMNMNLQRLGQTRQFLSSMTGQGEQAINDQYGHNYSGEMQNYNEALAKNNAAYQRLSGMAGQENENLAQRQQTQASPGWAAALGGIGQGASMGAISSLNQKAPGTTGPVGGK